MTNRIVSNKASLTTLLKNPQICGVCHQCQEDCLGHLCPCALDMGSIYQYTMKLGSGNIKKGLLDLLRNAMKGVVVPKGVATELFSIV